MPRFLEVPRWTGEEFGTSKKVGRGVMEMMKKRPGQRVAIRRELQSKRLTLLH
jgi:hypothetical protein